MEQRKRTTNIRWGIFPIFGSIRVGAGSARVELFVLCVLLKACLVKHRTDSGAL